jgi:N-acetyl-beta-hexosaminidase
MKITDWPALKYRGWMDDISRGPIVSMDYLKNLIPILAEYKLNFFNLYTEHTFKSEKYPDIAPADGLTATEINELQDFAAQFHIEIVGNQQCLAHAEEILKNPFYDNLVDTKDCFNVGSHETYDFLNNLLAEVSEAYDSPLFNINCDETQGLGNGKARGYVDKTGATNAYVNHIVRVHDILKKHGKRTMMWGDIAASHPEITQNLPSDLLIIAWSYDGLDSFVPNVKPFIKSGFEFMIAPGVSMWGSTFPDMEIYTKNIANFVRDGYQNGAVGMMNTAWDDSGESLINSGLHGLIWGAEMSWNPIENTEISKSELERSERQKHFDQNFNVQFFGNANDDIISALWKLDNIKELPIGNLRSFGSMTEDLLLFFPSQISEKAFADNTIVFEKCEELIPILTNAKSQATTNAEIFDNAIYATNRMRWCTERNLTRIQLYKTFNETTAENIAISRQKVKDLLASLHNLKKEYIKVWDYESRNSWREVNLKKYDEVAQKLLTLELYTFIESQATDEGKVSVNIRTLFNDKEIHYTLDGAEVKKSSAKYDQPVEIDQSCLVKVKAFGNFGSNLQNEKYILCHKGIGKFKKLNSVAGNYRPEYSGGGDKALLNGIVGSDSYTDGKWQGFYGTDADIELDFRKKESIKEIEIGFLVHPYDWILQADSILFFTSNDGLNYNLFKTHQIQDETEGNKIFSETISFQDLRTRFLRIVVKNPGLIPEGLPGHDYDSWIFMDEIIVK